MNYKISFKVSKLAEGLSEGGSNEIIWSHLKEETHAIHRYGNLMKIFSKI